MLRSLLSRFRLRPDPDQLELTLDPGREFLGRLQRLGLRGIEQLTVTTNRTVYVSFKGNELRVQKAFLRAPENVLRAIVVFVCGRGVERRAARKIILDFPIPGRVPGGKLRSERLHPDDRHMADRLVAEHERLNEMRFGGALKRVRISVSRRMRTRLGHYAPAASHGRASIVLSRRHIRRHGWEEAIDTLLHEMVHQWQEESGLPVDHGPAFRRKAREVGTQPRARRVLG